MIKDCGAVARPLIGTLLGLKNPVSDPVKQYQPLLRRMNVPGEPLKM